MKEEIKQRLKDNLRKAQQLQNEFAQGIQDAIDEGLDINKLQEEITREMITGISVEAESRAKMKKV